MPRKELPTPPSGPEAADHLEALGTDERRQINFAGKLGVSRATLLIANGTLIISLLSWAIAGAGR